MNIADSTENANEEEIKSVALEANEIIIQNEPINLTVRPSTSGSHQQSIHPTRVMPNGKQDKRLLTLISPDKLTDALLPTFEALYYKVPESIPFRQPIDAHNPEFHDFCVIIKNPIDLSIIGEKLINNSYGDPWDYVEDVWRMFNNAWLYSRRSSDVYKYSNRLSHLFIHVINPVMESLGYCCGNNYSFGPEIYCCYENEVSVIQDTDYYYTYENRYNVCKKCFEDIPDSSVTFINSATQHKISIMKDQFDYELYQDSEKFIFIYCKDCGRKFHKICVLYFAYNKPSGYTCATCVKIQKSLEIQ